MLFLTIALPLNASVINDNSPQLEDEEGDAFGYLDIVSVTFFEKETEPDFLFVVMNINEPARFKFQQTFAVFWMYNQIQYACGLGLGFRLGENWSMFDAGTYDNQAPHGGPGIVTIDGTYDFQSGTIIWKIPKEIIGNPQKGDTLTHIWANAFRRLGVLGRIGFSRPLLNTLCYMIFGNHLWDGVPNGAPDEFGLDYTIQY